LPRVLGKGFLTLGWKMGRNPVACKVRLGGHLSQKALSTREFGDTQKSQGCDPELKLLRGKITLGL